MAILTTIYFEAETMLDYKAILTEAYWMSECHRAVTDWTRDPLDAESNEMVEKTTDNLMLAVIELMEENERLKAIRA